MTLSHAEADTHQSRRREVRAHAQLEPSGNLARGPAARVRGLQPVHAPHMDGRSRRSRAAPPDLTQRVLLPEGACRVP